MFQSFFLFTHESKSIILTVRCQEARINFAPMILSPELIVLILLVVWLLVITVLFLRFYFYFTRAAKKGDKKSLIALIDEVLRREIENEKAIERVNAEYDTLKHEVSFHVQKMGLLRFNPFKDTGGDQSFIVTLVDGHNSGVIISSFHTRAGTRWYAKSVKNGKGVEHALSSEEEQALKEAKTIQ